MDGLLIASAADTEVALTETEERGIYGTALVFNANGVSSAGPTRFMPGSLVLPEELSRVKLLLDHDATAPLGVLSSAELTDERFNARFRVAEGDQGDELLAQAKDGRRDGLSVGCHIEDWHMDGQTIVITKATLHEVSMVSIPAFSDSRITEVYASRKDNIVTAENFNEIDITAATESEIVMETVVTAAAPIYAGSTSFGIGGLTDVTASYLKGNPAEGLANFVKAALADVTPVSLGTPEGPTAPAYVGELWEAADVNRPLLDSLTIGTLASLKMFGFRWETRPTVGRYAGNKAEIPTNSPSRERAEWTAQRFAGGWDVDRVFIDLPGGTDFLRDIYVEATKDYKAKTEAYAIERVLAEGTVVPTESTVDTAALLTTVGLDVSAIKGGRIDIVQMGSARYASLLALKEDEVPFWLRAQSNVSLTEAGGAIGGIRFAVNHDLDDNDVLVIDSRAVKAQEHNPLIQVQALNVPDGGVDLGVFGYMAIGVTDSRLVRVYRDTTP